ncbi:hypothetical protein EGJ28_10595 [Stutzerimonas xanthomarina]|uniref:DUF2970 domain-containing protein n=1 Tax=Stutzerimonas xanthomarina TaxID=271420 RepID=A0A3R8V9B7_9GAMM|nr:hypothetical protein EGJ28_10595 [Stutzerimonas xanthomarina]
MEAIVGIIFEVALRAVGLLVLKVLTFGRYKDTNSYLHHFPSFVGLLFIVLLMLLILVILWAFQSI